MEMMVYTNGNEENVQKDFEEQIEWLVFNEEDKIYEMVK